MKYLLLSLTLIDHWYSKATPSSLKENETIQMIYGVYIFPQEIIWIILYREKKAKRNLRNIYMDLPILQLFLHFKVVLIEEVLWYDQV